MTTTEHRQRLIDAGLSPRTVARGTDEEIAALIEYLGTRDERHAEFAESFRAVVAAGEFPIPYVGMASGVIVLADSTMLRVSISVAEI